MTIGEKAVVWVYIRSEPGLFTVGFYRPDGTWEPESDHARREGAAERVSYLNGNATVEPLRVSGTGHEPSRQPVPSLVQEVPTRLSGWGTT